MNYLIEGWTIKSRYTYLWHFLHKFINAQSTYDRIFLQSNLMNYSIDSHTYDKNKKYSCITISQEICKTDAKENIVKFLILFQILYFKTILMLIIYTGLYECKNFINI